MAPSAGAVAAFFSQNNWQISEIIVLIICSVHVVLPQIEIPLHWGLFSKEFWSFFCLYGSRDGMHGGN